MILLLAAGCAEDPPEPAGPVALIAADAWEIGGDDDPFVDHRPADARCDAGAVVEGSTLEVDTGACAWLWATQPARGAVGPGAPLEFVFWHGWLDAPEPAEAHVAVTIDGRLAWETFVPVPSEPVAYTEHFDSPVAASAGAPIGLHLHNHGANTWNVLRLDR